MKKILINVHKSMSQPFLTLAYTYENTRFIFCCKGNFDLVSRCDFIRYLHFRGHPFRPGVDDIGNVPLGQSSSSRRVVLSL